MLRTFVAAAVLATLALATSAQAQQLSIPDSDLTQYCFWNGRLFSIGAWFCSEKGKMLRCQPFTKDVENIGDRAWWVTLDRSGCSKADQPK
jgi:hypothetical protein